jgi:hypothetical protein
MTESISEEESFEYCLKYFLQSLAVLIMEPIELCDVWGNYNVAWELVADLKFDGKSINSSNCSYLTDNQRQEVHAFIDGLAVIPETLFVSATTATANQQAMSHACWVPIRKSADALIHALESASKRNAEYFKCL